MHSALLLTLNLLTAPAAPALEGDYLEVRTCDVWTGACFANAEVNLAGREATFAWSIRRGFVGDTDLSGLAAVAVLQASATLGDPYSDPAPTRAMLLLDERADPAERRALATFVRDRLGPLAGRVVEERAVAIDLEVGCCDARGCARLTAGDAVSVATRCVQGNDHVCGNEEVYYPPLTGGVETVPAVADDHRVVAPALGLRFQDAGCRGAFTGTFRVAAPAAAPRPVVQVAANPTDAPERYKLTELRSGDSEASPALPEEIPAAFRALLDPAGLRVERNGKPLYDLWFRAEVPLLAEARGEMSVRFDRVPVGTVIGALRSYGQEVDYRESPIDKGFYALRYGLQPSDGDHLGTAPTRDFLVLTGFADDTSPDPISGMDLLVEIALLASSTEHPLVMHLLVPADEPANRRRLYRHEERDEWIADVTLAARAPQAEETSELRLGIVVAGVSEHY